MSFKAESSNNDGEIDGLPPTQGLHPDERDQIQATLAGESSAFEALVLKYQDRLFRSLYHMTRSREEAEDVTQEAFIQSYLKLSTFHQNSQFYTWLFRIAFNLSISRRRKKRPAVSTDHGKQDHGIETVDPLPSPDTRLEQKENIAAVHRALDRLSQEHRSILVMRAIEGFDYQTISKTLELPVGTVRSRLSRARQKLKDELEREGYGLKQP